MSRVYSTITTEGQMTVPAEVLAHLGVGCGDEIIWEMQPDGSVQVRRQPYPTLASLAGSAGTLPRPMSWAEMIEIAHEDAAWEKFGPRVTSDDQRHD